MAIVAAWVVLAFGLLYFAVVNEERRLRDRPGPVSASSSKSSLPRGVLIASSREFPSLEAFPLDFSSNLDVPQ